MRRFNLNEKVRVRPTPVGLKAYRDYYDGKLGLETDADGWAEMQAHEVMRVFGPLMEFGLWGAALPVEMTLEIPD